MQRIAIFGGTFDPIHKGHLQTSLNLQTHFKFDSYIFLPCKIPSIKPPAFANSQQRIEMIQLAIKDYPEFKLDLREIERNTPSYMVDTLESFRREYPLASITLILGHDAFLSLPKWHQWEKLITLAHLLVIHRVGVIQQTIPDIMQGLMKQYQSNDETILLTTQASTIFLFNAGSYDMSSTTLREAIKKGNDVRDKLPHSVYDYIKTQGLYTQDTSKC